MSNLWPNEGASATEALFDAREKIEDLEDTTIRQGARILALLIENIALLEDADEELGGRYGRLCDAVHAIEHFASGLAFNDTPAPSQIMQELLQDAIDYGESGRLTVLLSAAMEVATEALEEGES